MYENVTSSNDLILSVNRWSHVNGRNEAHARMPRRQSLCRRIEETKAELAYLRSVMGSVREKRRCKKRLRDLHQQLGARGEQHSQRGKRSRDSLRWRR